MIITELTPREPNAHNSMEVSFSVPLVPQGQGKLGPDSIYHKVQAPLGLKLLCQAAAAHLEAGRGSFSFIYLLTYLFIQVF